MRKGARNSTGSKGREGGGSILKMVGNWERNFAKKSPYLSVNVFSTGVLIGDTVYSRSNWNLEVLVKIIKVQLRPYTTVKW